MDLPEALISLLHQPSTCYIATTMPDGSPQLTQIWVKPTANTCSSNAVQGVLKVRNVERDPRMAVSVSG